MNTFDVIVVGGGIVGASITFELLQRHLRVICIEVDSQPQASASLASGAMLGALGEVTDQKSTPADEAETAFRVHSARLYAGWVDEVSQMAGQELPVRCGTFVISNTSGKDDDLNIDAIREAALRHGLPLETVRTKDVPGLAPHSSMVPRQVVFLPEESFINSLDIMAGLRKANQQLTAKTPYLEGKVVSIIVSAGRVAGVRAANNADYWAPSVVLCCGTYIGEILEASGLTQLNLPRVIGGKGSSSVIRSAVDLPFVIRTPNRDFACGTHVIPRADGRIYVGATNRISSTPAADDGVTAGELHVQMHSLIHEINTAFRLATVESVRFGSRPLCIDGYPIIGETALEGLLIATGTYRNGMLMAPLIAKIISASIMDQIGPENPFAPAGRRHLTPKLHPNEVIERGVRDLISFMQEPHGMLPYNRAQELSDMVTVLLQSVLVKDDENTKVLDCINEQFRETEMPEVVPMLLYWLHGMKNKARR